MSPSYDGPSSSRCRHSATASRARVTAGHPALAAGDGQHTSHQWESPASAASTGPTWTRNTPGGHTTSRPLLSSCASLLISISQVFCGPLKDCGVVVRGAQQILVAPTAQQPPDASPARGAAWAAPVVVIHSQPGRDGPLLTDRTHATLRGQPVPIVARCHHIGAPQPRRMRVQGRAPGTPRPPHITRRDHVRAPAAPALTVRPVSPLGADGALPRHSIAAGLSLCRAHQHRAARGMMPGTPLHPGRSRLATPRGLAGAIHHQSG
jgi:hypothetical protein